MKIGREYIRLVLRDVVAEETGNVNRIFFLLYGHDRIQATCRRNLSCVSEESSEVFGWSGCLLHRLANKS
jgi:hypothetical protein